MEVEPAFQTDPSALEKIYVRSNNGKLVPLSAVAKFQPGNAYLSVNHQGQFPSVTFSFNLAPGASLGAVTESIQRTVNELPLEVSKATGGDTKRISAAVNEISQQIEVLAGDPRPGLRGLGRSSLQVRPRAGRAPALARARGHLAREQDHGAGLNRPSTYR